MKVGMLKRGGKIRKVIEVPDEVGRRLIDNRIAVPINKEDKPKKDTMKEKIEKKYKSIKEKDEDN